MSINTSKILIRPIITEKATFLSGDNKYVFEVSSEANKIEVAKAFETTYKIKPIKINIVRVKGKAVRYGQTSGRTKLWKKAIITLKAGDKIELATS
jgi:large subunit ribosomal protein L23